MHATPLMIKNILKKNSIIDYLKNKGHHPVRQGGGKLSYNCPLPGHDESKPSFVVWTDAAYENYYCFGCQRSCNIIHLMSQMEAVSYRDVLERLSEGIDISPTSDVEYSLDKLSEEYQQPSPFETPELLLELSILCRLYLESVKFDNVEQCIIEKLWKQIDDDLMEYRFSDIEDTYCHLPLALAQRQDKWKSMQFERQKQEYASRPSH